MEWCGVPTARQDRELTLVPSGSCRGRGRGKGRAGRPEVRNQQVRDDQTLGLGVASQKPTWPVPRTCSSLQRAQWGAKFSWGQTTLCTVIGAEVIWRVHSETTQRGEGSPLDGEGVGHPQGEGEGS